MKIRILLCSFLLSGCVTIQTGTEPQAPKNNRLTKIDNVRLGMTYKEVAAVMGEKTTIGYERKNPTSQKYDPITVNNPYHKEFIKEPGAVPGPGNSYDVFYYFTHVQKADGIVAGDELTPLVFEKNILIGKGWDFLNKLKNKNTP